MESNWYQMVVERHGVSSFLLGEMRAKVYVYLLQIEHSWQTKEMISPKSSLANQWVIWLLTGVRVKGYLQEGAWPKGCCFVQKTKQNKTSLCRLHGHRVEEREINEWCGIGGYRETLSSWTTTQTSPVSLSTASKNWSVCPPLQFLSPCPQGGFYIERQCQSSGARGGGCIAGNHLFSK